MSSITQASTKAEIIGGALEIIDSQAETINNLKQRQVILFTIVGILSVLLAL
jgi:hypothetical protein